MSLNWTQADGVALRAFFATAPAQEVKEYLMSKCPAVIDPATILKSDDAQVARISAMRAGWEGAIDELIKCASTKPTTGPDPAYKDMS